MREITKIRNAPILEAWRRLLWIEVDMGHKAHNPEGFQYDLYCNSHFGPTQWVRYGHLFFFRSKENAVMFKLRWV